jgi:DNA topoisomerase-1
LGLHPETGGKIQASLGRFGPYVVHDQGKEGKEYRSLKGDDNVLTITLERALALLAEPKAGRGRRAAAKPLRELGVHPDDEEPINIYDGPYGPYIKHGKVNASLPEGQTLEEITLETALAALAAKASSKKSGKSSKSTKATKTSSKKASSDTTEEEKPKTTKKTTTKRASTTKTAAKKTSTKRTTATNSTRKKAAS